MLKRRNTSGMRLRIGVLAVATCAAGAVLVSSAVASRATTSPGATALVPVKLTNGSITVTPDRFTLKSNPKLARYPRGATITFKIQNEGTVPLSLVLRVLTKLTFYGANTLKTSVTTGKIAPTAIKRIRATFTFRGNYEFELVKKGKIVARNAISVF
jgi:hypothetical protein